MATSIVLFGLVALFATGAEAIPTRAFSVTTVVFTGSTSSPTVTVFGSGFGGQPASTSANSTSCGAYTNNGSWYGANGLWIRDDTHAWIAGATTACIGLIVNSWSDSQVSFHFGNAYNSFDHWSLDPGDSATVMVQGQSGSGTVDYSSYTLTTSAANGTISPAGGSYAAHTPVTLTASPAGGYSFGSWSGCDATNGATCTVTMNGNRSVSASFTRNQAALSVSASGSGHGTVTSSPGSINCGSTCSGSFDVGSSVTLTATPAAGSYFSGWSGGCSASAPTCVVNISVASNVVATFIQPQIHLASAQLTSGWRGSHSVGAVVRVIGDSNVNGTATVLLNRKGSAPVSVPLSLSGGNFAQAVSVPRPDLLPGVYSVSITAVVSGVTVAPGPVRGVLAAPANGVVKEAVFTLSSHGRPVARVPTNARELWVHLQFASLPRGRPQLSVQWTKPDGTPATPEPTPVRAAVKIVTGISINRGSINRGIWTIVLRNKKTIVFQTNIRTR